MRIKTQFIITMLLFGIVLAVIAVSAIITNQQTEKVSEQEKIASSIAQGASELSYLANDYLIYRESHQFSRWQSRFSSFSNQVASLNVDKPEQQVLVRNIQANTQRLKEVFDGVASTVRRPAQNQRGALDLSFFQVSWSRMAVQSQGLVSDASRLSQLLHQQMEQLRAIRTVLMYIMVILFGLLLLASYMLTYRRVLKSISTLQVGTAIIGSGNLNFAIREKKNDEIGDLSRAFNQMTINLKAVTASKADLEREITQRRQAEEDLRQQREWLRVTLSSIGDAVIAGDVKGRITFLNPVAVTLTGCQSEEVLGQPIQSVFRIINEKTRESAEDLVTRVLHEKRLVALASDTALVTRDGREIPIEDSAAPIRDSAGNAIGVILVFHDVTERRRTQAALREAHERAVWLARFPDENPNPVLRASGDGSVLYCNPASSERHGWTCEVGQLLQSELLPLVGRAMTEREEVQQDVELGGRSYFVSVTPFPGEGYANVYGRDITERKRMEEELKQSEEKFRLLIQHAPSMIYEIDFQRPAFKNVNDVMCQFLGYTREELLAISPFDLLDDEGKAVFRERIRRKLAGEAISDSEEYKSKTKDGREVYGVLNMTFTYKDGNLEGAVVVAHDITERKRAEEALRQRTFELQQLTETLEQRVRERTAELAKANETLRQLSVRLLSAQEEERKRIAGEIHDTLGACLSAIKFKVESVFQGITKTPNAPIESLGAIIPVIQEGVEECRRIQLDLRPSMLDDLGLLPTLSWFCRRFQTIYSGIRVDQEVTIEESEVPVSLKIVIYRVTQEAMNNSAKHSKANRLRLCLLKMDGRINLMVEDNGQGFDLEKVFDSENTNRGLGLTNMRERIELSGGFFEIESAKGKGTVVRGWWPV
ncbi:MAG: PAS domain S-box protein [bacterium]